MFPRNNFNLNDKIIPKNLLNTLKFWSEMTSGVQLTATTSSELFLKLIKVILNEDMIQL